MSGVPYIHADAGGFAGGDGDTELYTRWLQFAVFTPVLRPHGTALGDLVPDVKDIPSEAALYEEPTKSIVRRYIRLRYQMLPYNYTLAYEQERSGKPLVRPLFYYDNRDTNLYKAENEFMWGDNILVAPVIEKDAKRRLLYLPSGNWYNMFTGIISPGKQWINEKVDLDNIPVYVKAGSFIALFADSSMNNTADYSGKQLTINYYPSLVKNNYTLFDDDGHTNNNFSKGNYELIIFEGQAKGRNINIKIAPGNNYFMFNRELKIQLPTGIKMVSATVNNKPVVIYNNTVSIKYEGKLLLLKISI